MSKPHPVCLIGSLVLFSLFATMPGLASDGAIEINSVSAAEGGVTAGDTPGFPVSLTASGRYALTGNLVVHGAATSAIEILADEVVFDLNGFAIAGPGLCSGDPVSCSPPSSGNGVFSANTGVSVVNGSVSGMGGSGIVLGPHARIASVSSSFNPGSGVSVGVGSEVRESRIELNGATGVEADDGSLVIDNVIRGNLGLGLILGTDAGYANNVFSENAPPDITGGTELGANACPMAGGSCPAGQIDCGGFCASLDSDEANCGACGNQCSAGFLCSNMSCALSCQAGLTDCAGVCVNLQSDESNCSACGAQCGPAGLCVFSTCTVP